MKAVLLISHGSRLAKTKEEVSGLINQLKKNSSFDIYEIAFLEIESPSIPQGIDLCIKKGAAEIIVLLNFLNTGRHVDEDIPRIIRESIEKYPDVKIKLTKPLGLSPKLVDAYINLLQKAV